MNIPQIMNINNIDYIIDTFDYYTTHEILEILKWSWREFDQIPSVENIKTVVSRMVHETEQYLRNNTYENCISIYENCLYVSGEWIDKLNKFRICVQFIPVTKSAFLIK